jgi:hypothetical protein
VEDLGKEVGLFYAKTLPGGLAINAAILVFVLWLAVKAGDLDDSWVGPVRFGLAIFALFVIVQIPTAYSAAKDYCRDEWKNAGGSEYSREAPFPYTTTKCMSLWPHGPDQ